VRDWGETNNVTNGAIKLAGMVRMLSPKAANINSDTVFAVEATSAELLRVVRLSTSTMSVSAVQRSSAGAAAIISTPTEHGKPTEASLKRGFIAKVMANANASSADTQRPIITGTLRLLSALIIAVLELAVSGVMLRKNLTNCKVLLPAVIAGINATNQATAQPASLTAIDTSTG